MSRRPVTNARLGQLFAQRNIAEVNEGICAGFKRAVKDLFDEPPSTAVRKKPTAKRAPNYKRSIAEVTEYGQQVIKGLWECAEPKHLVGLYAALHAHLYAVPPLELQQDYGACLASATKLVKDEFAGDCLEAQRYVAWCVARAKSWKKQKERDGEEVVRVGWRLLFKGRKWLVDWKASGRG